MRLTRVFVDAALVPGERATLAGDAANHIARVLRLRAGDPVILFDGGGAEHAARIEEFGRNTVAVHVLERYAVDRESALDLTLLQGIARGDRMDTIVQKATELGVTRIVPVSAERSVVRVTGSAAARKQAHWRAIVIAACEQCGRNRLPELLEPQPLHAAVALAANIDARVTLAPDAGQSFAAAVESARSVALLVGPEGGLSSAEVELAARSGFVACRMGPRILRTETAALAALAALQTLAGDFGRPT